MREETTLGLDTNQSREGGLILRVLGETGFSTHVLPERGALVIGRSNECDVRVDEPSISRKHARLVIGEVLSIEDLGSANGTKIRDKRVAFGEICELSIGEAVELGSVMIVVQAASVTTRPKRLWTHGYFEGRLEDECARAAELGGELAVLRLHADGEKASMLEALAASLGSLDVMAEYGPSEYEVLLVGANESRAGEVARKIAGACAERGIKLALGLAVYGPDGRTPESLIAQACTELAGGEGDPVASGSIIVADEAMRRLYEVLDRVAKGTISVLLLGETGVGKEIVAEELHKRSPRADRPLVRINCGALTESLLESELFGHEKGAFTGAEKVKAGLFESADGGSVFLDEVGELPMSLQVKLLRVLEDRKVTRVGGLEARAIDVRFISATNRDLDQEVIRGRFRQDLYFRLNGIALAIPPLRERRAEILPLARTFIAAAAGPLGRSVPRLSSDAERALLEYAWPGNARELRNFMERAVLLCGAETIEREHLPMEKMKTAVPASLRAPVVRPASDVALDDALDAVEKQRILDALDACAGNQTKAARMLGISRGKLLLRLEKYGLPRPRKA